MAKEIVERRATRLLKDAIYEKDTYLFEKAMELAQTELDVDDPPSVGADGRITYRDWGHFAHTKPIEGKSNVFKQCGKGRFKKLGYRSYKTCVKSRGKKK